MTDRPGLHPAVKGFAALLFVAGFALRAAPLLDYEGRMMEQWPTEDGYFMLTMGRNVGIGNGLSVAGGLTPTNGTQPLTTMVWGVGYAMLGEERAPGVLFAQVLQLLVATLGALLLVRLGRVVLREREHAPAIAMLTSAIWYVSTLTLPHSMNCLETGFIGVCAIAIALVYLNAKDELWSWRRVFAFGALLGLGFWLRNDSAFLIAACCLGYLLPAWKKRDELKPRLARTLTFGATSVVVASPWLIFNQTNFGHIMPVSGRAEALTGHLFGNLDAVPVVVAEYVMGVVPIPEAVKQEAWAVAAACVVIAVVFGYALSRRGTFSLPERRLAFVVLVYLAFMSAFYGIYFGAAWFVPRYFYPLAAFLILLTVTVGADVFTRLEGKAFVRPLLGGAAVIVVALLAFLHWRIWKNQEHHPHFQVVHWIEENVDDETWVGAIQTGTLGFFHDKTVNLDGKVNVDAYEALVNDRQGEYVVEDTEIMYLADWMGMLDWQTKPAIAEHFEVLVDDEERNLAVLARIGRPTTP